MRRERRARSGLGGRARRLAAVLAAVLAGEPIGAPGAAILAALVVLSVSAVPGAAFEARVLESVVSVLPVWPGHKIGGTPGTPPGSAPEATAVAVRPGGLLATALHVVDRAESIAVRLADGRRFPAELVASDGASDLALLRVAVDLPPLEPAPEPALGEPVCAVGNAFGLDLSVTCGVVSATRRSGVGFNPVEDFIQTDASVNPGASGGALVDRQGRLVGLLSAIFTKDADADIGVNFAVSAALLMRVVDDLAAHGRVRRPASGFRVADLEPGELAGAGGAGSAGGAVGVRVVAVAPGGAGEAAGLVAGDLLTAIAGRAMRKASDATAAIQLQRPGERVRLEVRRQGEPRSLSLELPP
jgi:S1-C subfamily serine protease